MTQPKVIKAAATDATTVEVTFDQGMQSNALFLDSSSYTIEPEPIDVGNITVAIVGATIARLTLPVNLKHGQSYTVVVNANLQNVASETMNPGFLSADFVGIGDAPAISSATALDKTTVRVVFSEPMLLDDISDPTKYKITSDTTGKIVGVSAAGPIDEGTGLFHRVDLTINTKMTNGGQHTLVIQGMSDAAGNPQAVGENTNFIGIADLPRVEGLTISQSTGNLTVKFDTPMDDSWATSLSAYAIEPTPGASPVYYSSATISTDGLSVEIDITETLNNAAYDFVVSNLVRDHYGNTIDPAFNSGVFFGVGIEPTVIRAVAISQNRLDVVFSEKMADNVEIRNASRYTVDNGLTVLEVLEVDGDTVKLVTTDQIPQTLYTLTIS